MRFAAGLSRPEPARDLPADVAPGIDLPPAVTLLYHDVCSDRAESGFQRRSARAYKHRPGEFLAHLGAFAAAAPPPLRVDDYAIRGHEGFGYAFMLTFDDGGKSALYVADELERRGWPAHFFVTTSMIGARGFLDAGDIRRLHERGHAVGSHSHSHPAPFRALSPERMLGEWKRSAAILADILGSEVTCASVPGGDSSPEAEAAAARAGLQFLFTSEPRTAPWRRGPLLCFGRVCPKAGASLRRVRRLAANRGFGRELAVRRTKNAVRTLLGPAYHGWVAVAHRGS